MTAGTFGTGNDQIRNEVGLAQSHAYSLLGAFEINAGGTKRIFHMRNPWKAEQYSGEFADNKDVWNTYDLKGQLERQGVEAGALDR